MALDILLADDDPTFAEALARALRDLDCVVAVVGDTRAAWTRLSGGGFDAIAIGGHSARLDAVSFVRTARQSGMTLPIVLLGTSAVEADIVEALDAGADDHLARPLRAAELRARLDAILRGRRWATGPGDTIRAGDIVVAPASFRAWHMGRPLDLPRLEFALLVELARNAGQVLPRSTLIARVWGYDEVPVTNVLDVHIRRLRLKLTAEGAANPIVTMRGVGYMLRG